VPGSNNISIDKVLETIHPIEDYHGTTLVEYGQFCDECWWELVQQTSH
jgi:hypothetical protein